MSYVRSSPPTPQPPQTAPITRALIQIECWRGNWPAELLTVAEREHLIFELWSYGWTDVQIASHTKLSTYTTGRIRGRLGLAAHPVMEGRVA